MGHWNSGLYSNASMGKHTMNLTSLFRMWDTDISKVSYSQGTPKNFAYNIEDSIDGKYPEQYLQYAFLVVGENPGGVLTVEKKLFDYSVVITSGTNMIVVRYDYDPEYSATYVFDPKSFFLHRIED